MIITHGKFPGVIGEELKRAFLKPSERQNKIETVMQELIDAADDYDAEITKMEKEKGRPDMYFTQHSKLLPLRKAIRTLRDLR
jgi:hypothetical protein